MWWTQCNPMSLEQSFLLPEHRKRIRDWELGALLLLVMMDTAVSWGMWAAPDTENYSWLTASKGAGTLVIQPRRAELSPQPEWGRGGFSPRTSRWNPRLAEPWLHPGETPGREPSRDCPDLWPARVWGETGVFLSVSEIVVVCYSSNAKLTQGFLRWAPEITLVSNMPLLSLRALE